MNHRQIALGFEQITSDLERDNRRIQVVTRSAAETQLTNNKKTPNNTETWSDLYTPGRDHLRSGPISKRFACKYSEGVHIQNNPRISRYRTMPRRLRSRADTTLNFPIVRFPKPIDCCHCRKTADCVLPCANITRVHRRTHWPLQSSRHGVGRALGWWLRLPIRLDHFVGGLIFGADGSPH